jgi:imidazoleglycerol-phosphate dehydratase
MIELELLTFSLINSTMAGKTEQRVRSAALARDTNETKIQLAINIDGGAFPKETDSKLTNGADGHATQASKLQTLAINSGIGFLDHMLHALAKHAGWSLALNCKGDLHSRYSGLFCGVEANAWICS